MGPALTAEPYRPSSSQNENAGTELSVKPVNAGELTGGSVNRLLLHPANKELLVRIWKQEGTERISAARG